MVLHQNATKSVLAQEREVTACDSEIQAGLEAKYTDFCGNVD